MPRVHLRTRQRVDTGDRRVRGAIEWAAIIAAALIAALVIKTWLIQAFYIPSESMVPTLVKDDRVLVNKLSYRLHGVHRGDIVVFERPPGDAGAPEIKDLIKRVVALPGETVETDADGRVLINGRVLKEPYLENGVKTVPGITKQTIPAGRYWVMGDNRGNSKDSRVIGTIPEDDIVGRAFVRVFPITSLTLL
jgi:signal peptidase I